MTWVAKWSERKLMQVNATREDLIRRLGVIFLATQGLGGLAWWLVLLAVPGTRGYFVVAGAPEPGASR
jgi:hypothetical protein